MDYSHYPIVFGVRVNPNLFLRINQWFDKCTPRTRKLLKRKRAVLQGAGDAKRSKGTHKDGWCLDPRTTDLSDDDVLCLINDINMEGCFYFAGVLRLKGDLGAGSGEHIHMAAYGYANYAAVKHLIMPGRPNHISKKLAKRH